jgi:hypothetical protein
MTSFGYVGFVMFAPVSRLQPFGELKRGLSRARLISQAVLSFAHHFARSVWAD